MENQIISLSSIIKFLLVCCAACFYFGFSISRRKYRGKIIRFEDFLEPGDRFALERYLHKNPQISESVFILKKVKKIYSNKIVYEQPCCVSADGIVAQNVECFEDGVIYEVKDRHFDPGSNHRLFQRLFAT